MTADRKQFVSTAISGSEPPDGWTTVSLEQIATTRLGKMLDAAKQFGEDHPYLRNINVRWGMIEIQNLETMAFTESEVEEFAIRDGDVLICEGGEPGRSAVWDLGETDIKFQKAIHRVRTNSALDPKWLNYHLRNDAVRGSLEEYLTGSTIKHFTGVSLKRYRLRLPPLAEQRRIVAKVEELLEKVSACRQRLAKIPTLLKRFRQSILAAACSGRLTADWRPKHTDDRHGMETESLSTLPSSWTIRPLDSLCELITKGASPKWQGVEYVSNGLMFVTSENVGSGTMLLNEPKYVQWTFNEIQPRSVLKQGDVLTNLVGASIGRTAIFDRDVPANINQAVGLIRLNPEVSNRFVMHVLNSPSLLDHMDLRKVDVARANVSLKDVREFPIPLPPIDEQHEVVLRIEQLFALADQLETRYRKADTHVEKLTQAILAKAFRGELVPTEHELAAREGRDYESAEQLLARVRQTESPSVPAKRKPKEKAAEPPVSSSPRQPRVSANPSAMVSDAGFAPHRKPGRPRKSS